MSTSLKGFKNMKRKETFKKIFTNWQKYIVITIFVLLAGSLISLIPYYIYYWVSSTEGFSVSIFQKSFIGGWFFCAGITSAIINDTNDFDGCYNFMDKVYAYSSLLFKIAIIGYVGCVITYYIGGFVAPILFG